jgi:ankyrin repeat protein
VDECLDDNGTTLLMAAAYRGLEGVVRECLENMADVRKANTYGNTGLHFCIARVSIHL